MSTLFILVQTESNSYIIDTVANKLTVFDQPMRLPALAALSVSDTKSGGTEYAFTEDMSSIVQFGYDCLRGKGPVIMTEIQHEIVSLYNGLRIYELFDSDSSIGPVNPALNGKVKKLIEYLRLSKYKS